jgi:nitroreductase
MLPITYPVIETIQQRYSCRTYEKKPIAPEHAGQLRAFLAVIKTGPLGTPLRFELAAVSEEDRGALKGLGTYGFIKDPAGFLIGALGSGEKALEDFGWGMENAVLFAANLGLGTCWLGGLFTRSTFAKKIKASRKEIVPAVVAAGYPAEGSRSRDMIRRVARSENRLPWEALFYQDGFARALAKEEAGAYAAPLEMVRLAPSASNRQPWRVVRSGGCFHFYLQRSPGYAPGLRPLRLAGLADLQRADMGIALCHFELAARALGLAGHWEARPPALDLPGGGIEYTASWIMAQ